MGDICSIDVDYYFFDDTPKDRDPDTHSRMLRLYHQMLWSKPLPDGRAFELHAGRALAPYLEYEGDGKRFVLGSDTIATRHRMRLSHLDAKLTPADNEAFTRRAYTISGFMVFPVGSGHSLNQDRGMHPRIQDRWDLTLEAIRRHYVGAPSPLAETLDRYADFFGLFGTFEGYLDHFVLRDFVDANGKVQFLLPFDDFKSPVLPADLETYTHYRRDSQKLFKARRLSIQKEIDRRCVVGHANP
jgi:hypothetical protein